MVVRRPDGGTRHVGAHDESDGVDGDAGARCRVLALRRRRRRRVPLSVQVARVVVPGRAVDALLPSPAARAASDRLQATLRVARPEDDDGDDGDGQGGDDERDPQRRIARVRVVARPVLHRPHHLRSDRAHVHVRGHGHGHVRPRAI